MSEVKTVILNSDGEAVTTPYITQDVQITKRMRIPLYVAGQLKSDEELAALGLTVRRYTQAELDAEECAGLYAANPDLARRVGEYKGYLDQLGLAYTATTDDIEEAVAMSISIEDKEAFVLRIKTAFDNVVLNLQAVNPDYTSFNAWEKMPVLIATLPLATAEPSSEAGSDPSDPSDPSDKPEQGAE